MKYYNLHIEMRARAADAAASLLKDALDNENFRFPGPLEEALETIDDLYDCVTMLRSKAKRLRHLANNTEDNHD